MAKSQGKAVLIGSLDSIVTLCTNASAALIIVALVTMITIGGRIKEIVFQNYASQLSPAALAEVKNNQDDIKQMLGQVKQRAGTIPDVRLPQELLGADDIRMLITDLRGVVSDPKSLDALRSANDLGKVLAAERRSTIIQRQIEQYQAALNTPGEASKKPKVINLPWARPAPADVTPITFICRNNRVYLFDTDALSVAMEDAIRKALDRPPGKIAILTDDLPKLVTYFSENDVGDSQIRLSLDSQRGVLLVLEYLPRSEGIGESVDQIRGENSKYQQLIKGADPNKQLVRFIAFSDSFEIFNVARQIAIDAGLLCSWDPRPKDETVREVLFGSGSKAGPTITVD